VLSRADDRRSTVEYQYQRRIDLTKVDVVAIIAPEDIADDKTVQHFAGAQLNCALVPYTSYHDDPYADAVLIRDTARQFLEHLKRL
jgi:hypothetical protein